MLQFITDNTQAATARQINFALSHDITWIEYNPMDAADAEITALLREIMPKCKEKDCILVITNHIEIATELKLDGVMLTDSAISPRFARQAIGDGAILGVAASTSHEIESLTGIDVDYVRLGRSSDAESVGGLSIAEYEEIMKSCREKNIALPVVASGDISPLDVPALLQAGVNTIALSYNSITRDGEDVIEQLNALLAEYRERNYR